MSITTPIYTIGRVLQILEFPCATPPQIWVECAVPALLKAFVTLIDPNEKQVIKAATGKSWLKHAKNILHDVVEVEPIAGAGGVKFLFELAEVLDKVTWYVFLADVATDFLFNWTSMVYRRSHCFHDDIALTITGGDAQGGIVAGGSWGYDGNWTETAPDFGQTLTNTVIIPANTHAVWCTSINVSSDTGAWGGVKVRYRRTNDDVEIDSDYVPGNALKNGSAIMLFSPLWNNSGYDQEYVLEYQADEVEAPFTTYIVQKGYYTLYLGETNPFY